MRIGDPDRIPNSFADRVMNTATSVGCFVELYCARKLSSCGLFHHPEYG